MEPDNESSGLNSSYYHHHPQQHPLPPRPTPTHTPTTLPLNPTLPSPSNGITISTPNINNNNYNSVPSSGAPHMVYSHALTSAVSTPLETVKRKRGRPRKYGTPELAAAAKRFGATGSSPVSSTRKGQGFSASAGVSCVSSRKSQFSSLGNSGQGFTPHVISVNPGEDVSQKISAFMEQSNREMCILSASGTVSSASLRQPATSGGSVTYEGQFEILTLKGSYVRSEFGGRTGGISVCLVSEGQIFGGGLGGPLIAGGPVQVILGSFVIDTKKDMAGATKVDAPTSKMASPVGGASVSGHSGVSFRSPVDSPHENIGGGQFVLQPHAMHMTPSQSMEWRGSSSHGMQQSPENGDFEHMPE
ncbi:hypothetical protein Leryth_002618 [Lithospermum erythrorhizon]|nr:hypothetical protein Leryth_002618 [Lithospermum erythrorhizon]